MNLNNLLCLQHFTDDFSQLVEIVQHPTEVLHIFLKVLLCCFELCATRYLI